VDQHHFGCNTKLPKKRKKKEKKRKKHFFQVSMDNRHFGYEQRFLAGPQDARDMTRAAGRCGVRVRLWSGVYRKVRRSASAATQ
jgi:hypothetical protein